MCTREECNCDECLQSELNTGHDGARSRAWAKWYQRDSNVVRSFMLRRLRGDEREEVAEDLTQDAFVIGYQLLVSGRYPATGNNLCGLLIGIAKRLLLKNGRTRHRRGPSLDEVVEPVASDLAMDETVLLREVCALVMGALMRQQEKNRDLLIALCVRRTPVRSLASTLGTNEANVRLHAHRAVKRIIRDIDRQCGLSLSTDAVRLCLEQAEFVGIESQTAHGAEIFHMPHRQLQQAA